MKHLIILLSFFVSAAFASAQDNLKFEGLSALNSVSGSVVENLELNMFIDVQKKSKRLVIKVLNYPDGDDLADLTFGKSISNGGARVMWMKNGVCSLSREIKGEGLVFMFGSTDTEAASVPCQIVKVNSNVKNILPYQLVLSKEQVKQIQNLLHTAYDQNAISQIKQ